MTYRWTTARLLGYTNSYSLVIILKWIIIVLEFVSNLYSFPEAVKGLYFEVPLCHVNIG